MAKEIKTEWQTEDGISHSTREGATLHATRKGLKPPKEVKAGTGDKPTKEAKPAKGKDQDPTGQKSKETKN